MNSLNKKEKGQYFTIYNPFDNEGFKEWSQQCNLTHQTILEPFAGCNNLIKMLQEMRICKTYKSYDAEPQDLFVEKRDTLLDFPKGFDCCITNPPYLSQNSATRKKLNIDCGGFDDLYKYALQKCLNNCKYVGAIIPASFINAGIFKDRLSHYILLNKQMFNDTEHPVCLALFNEKSQDTKCYEDNKYLGLLSELEKKKPYTTKNYNMTFNDKNGKLGLIAIDNTKEPSIRFCKGEEISQEKIKITSRSITRINIDYDIDKLIKKANSVLQEFRLNTYDIFLTPFKGLRADGHFRRRLDFAIARQIINYCCDIG